MSIELVDKIDQQAKQQHQHQQQQKGSRSRRYQKVAGLNDLFLDEDGGSVAGGSVSSQASDYVGLELETVMEQAKTKKRFSRLVVFVLCVAIAVAIGVHVSRSNNVAPQPGDPNSNANLRNPGNGNGSNGSNDDDDYIEGGGEEEPKPHSSPHSSPTDNPNETVDVTTTIGAWPTAAPLKEFEICQPKMHYEHHNKRIHHLHDLQIVPEDKSANSDTSDYDEWQYTFSAMDIDEMASIIAVGLADFGRSSDYYVGMVRTFAFDCKTKKYKPLGQDLVGEKQGDGFGTALSSSKDGKVMAVSAVQDNGDDENANGYVQVYYLDGNVWSTLGQRIEELEDSEDYYNLGSAIDLSDNGEVLAILGIVSETKFVTRIFEYDVNSKTWTRKGHDLVVNVDDTEESWWSFQPRVSLSEDGDELSMLDPKIGLIKYHFQFEKDKWVQADNRMPNFNADDHWVEGLDFDESGDLIAFSAYDWGDADDESSNQHIAKVVDFSASDGTVTEIYNKTTDDITVGINLAVSSDGSVAAIVESKYDMDDNAIWEYDDVGAMTIISKNKHGVWKVLGHGDDCEEMGVPGAYVTLSGDGTIAAVGTDSVIALYFISLNHPKDNSTEGGSTTASTETTTTEIDPDDDTPVVDVTVTEEDPGNAIPNTTVVNATFFDICAPFPKETTAKHVGDIDNLPEDPDQHTLSISLSGDASIVAVGIDSFEEDNRGMVRIFGWDCQNDKYAQMGQDLFGDDDFDGFGQSVDVSSDGKTLVVGANQPPPGKVGYVDIYYFDDDAGLWMLDDRFSEVHEDVEDIGREVRISSDGSTVAIHGSFVDKEDGGFLNSFIRIIEHNTHTGKWNNKGDDLMSSIEYDDYGTSVKLSFAANGRTLGVTGSYSTFMAKMYTFSHQTSNWTETIIPPMKSSKDVDDDDDEETYFDEYCSEYFDGNDIALSDDGASVAISGMQMSDGTTIVRVLALDAAGSNWTMSQDPVDYDKEYSANSIDISGDAQILAVGINTNDDTKSEQGTLYISQTDDSGWTKLGHVDGKDTNDLLGSRVSVSSDGSVVAASSRKGYVSFFKTDKA